MKLGLFVWWVKLETCENCCNLRKKSDDDDLFFDFMVSVIELFLLQMLTCIMLIVQGTFKSAKFVVI